MKGKNRFKETWEKIESAEPPPKRFRKFVTMDFKEFEEKVLEQNPSFVEEIVGSLYAGDTYLIKRVFPKELMLEIRTKVAELWTQTPSSFHKIVEGCPDFHRAIDATLCHNYYANPVKHPYYFFPWNRDPFNLFERLRDRWRLFRFFGALDWDQYEKNTPKDGIVNRIQVVNYPSGAGKIDTHWDPTYGMKIAWSTYMSKRGVDFQSGGFYVVDQQDRIIDAEDDIDIGDCGFSYPTIAHGVALIDPGVKPDFYSTKGRWWLSMWSLASDMVKDRPIGGAVPEVGNPVVAEKTPAKKPYDS